MLLWLIHSLLLTQQFLCNEDIIVGTPQIWEHNLTELFHSFIDADEIPLTETDLKNVLIIVKSAASRWYDIGIYLGFPDWELKAIQSMPLLLPGGVNGFLREMLSQWLKWAPPKHKLPTKEWLAAALRYVGEEKIAHDFTLKWSFGQGLCAVFFFYNAELHVFLFYFCR